MLPLAYAIQLLDDGEDEESRYKADAGKNTPDGDEVEVLTPHDARYHDQLVTDGCGTEPETHHQTSILWRSYLRYKRNTDW